MNAEVTGLIRSAGQVTGVQVETPDGPMTVGALLTIGADGRHSVVRQAAGLTVEVLGAPIDVLWMRLPRLDSDRSEILGVIRRGRVLVMLNRGDYWQCAFVIAKGGFGAVKEKGLDAFREDIAATVPFMADRVGALRSWDDIKLLTVMVDRLQQWHAPGLLCIGDAAHAMSPIGGVGINLAIQDAVATANLLYRPLLARNVSVADLAAVQRRRLFPTRVTQLAQVTIQNRVLARAIRSTGPVTLPWPVRLLNDHPRLRRIPARLVGMGVRPEHIHTPEVGPS